MTDQTKQKVSKLERMIDEGVKQIEERFLEPTQFKKKASELRRVLNDGIKEIEDRFCESTVGALEEQFNSFARDNEDLIKELEEFIKNKKFCDGDCEAYADGTVLEILQKNREKIKMKARCQKELLTCFKKAIAKWLKCAYSKLEFCSVHKKQLQDSIKTFDRVILILKSERSAEQLEKIMARFNGGQYKWKANLGDKGMEALSSFYEYGDDDNRLSAITELERIKDRLQFPEQYSSLTKSVGTYDKDIEKLRADIAKVIVIEAETKKLWESSNEVLKKIYNIDVYE